MADHTPTPTRPERHPKRNWTQHDIVEEAEKQSTGPRFFNVLHTVADEAFGGLLDNDLGSSQFPMGKITIGELLDFFRRAPSANPCCGGTTRPVGRAPM
jgi:hypothetical protein